MLANRGQPEACASLADSHRPSRVKSTLDAGGNACASEKDNNTVNKRISEVESSPSWIVAMPVCIK